MTAWRRPRAKQAHLSRDRRGFAFVFSPVPIGPVHSILPSMESDQPTMQSSTRTLVGSSKIQASPEARCYEPATLGFLTTAIPLSMCSQRVEAHGGWRSSDRRAIGRHYRVLPALSYGPSFRLAQNLRASSIVDSVLESPIPSCFLPVLLPCVSAVALVATRQSAGFRSFSQER